jgi:hypothetical protein
MRLVRLESARTQSQCRSDDGDNWEQQDVEASQMLDLEVWWNYCPQRRRSIAADVMSRFVVLRPEEVKSRDRDHQKPTRDQLLSSPTQRPDIIGYVLNDIEHPKQVDWTRQGFGDAVLDYLESATVLLAGPDDRARFEFRPYDFTKLGEHRQVSSSAAAHLSHAPPDAKVWKIGSNRVRQDFSTSAPPPVNVFDRRHEIVLMRFHVKHLFSADESNRCRPRGRGRRLSRICLRALSS